MDRSESGQQLIDYLDRHKESLNRLCWSFSTCDADREDLFQEILLQVWNSMDRFDDRSRLSTWIYRIAIRTCWAASRSSSRDRKRRQAIDGVEHLRASTSTQDLVERREDLRRLRRAIDRLGKVERIAILLHLEDLSHREIADVLGISENLVAVRLMRTRRKLKNILEGAVHESQ